MGFKQRFVSEIKAKVQGGSQVNQQLFNFIRTGQIIWNAQNTEQQISQGYLINPHVYSIINLVVNALASIQWTLSIVKNETAAKGLPYLKHFTLEYEKARLKALEQVDEHPIIDKMRQPNPMQGWTEFIREHIGFKLVTGSGYINGVPFSDKKSFQEFWNMPSQLTKIIAGNWREPIGGYTLQISPTNQMTIAAENVMQSKFWNPIYENGQYLYGLSPLFPASRVVTSINETYTSRVSLFKNLGAMGILSGDNEMLALAKEDTKKVEDAYYEKYGGSDNRGKILVTNASLKWQSMIDSYDSFEFTKTELQDLRTMCNVYNGIPSQLLNDPENKTYNNQREAEKALWNRIVLPLAFDFRDEFVRWNSTRWEKEYGKKFFLEPNLWNVDVLQPEKKELHARVVNDRKYGIISGNTAAKILRYDESDNPEMNEIYVMGNMKRLGSENKNSQN
jgi:phage portal protein BeeE